MSIIQVDKFRVVEVSQFREKLIVNRGSDDGIKTLQEFIIYNNGREIIDPLTKESLGFLERIKARCCAVQVMPQMSILISNENRTTPREELWRQQTFGDMEAIPLMSVEVGDFVMTEELERLTKSRYLQHPIKSTTIEKAGKEEK